MGLNDLQAQVLDTFCAFPLDSISSDEIPHRISLLALESITDSSLLDEHKDEFVKWDVFDSIKQMRDIFEHPCPQNRSEGSPYVGQEPGLVVWLNEAHEVCREKPGLLGLTSRNDATTPAVKKEDVIGRLKQCIVKSKETVSTRAAKEKFEEDLDVDKHVASCDEMSFDELRAELKQVHRSLYKAKRERDSAEKSAEVMYKQLLQAKAQTKYAEEQCAKAKTALQRERLFSRMWNAGEVGDDGMSSGSSDDLPDLDIDDEAGGGGSLASLDVVVGTGGLVAWSDWTTRTPLKEVLADMASAILERDRSSETGLVDLGLLLKFRQLFEEATSENTSAFEMDDGRLSAEVLKALTEMATRTPRIEMVTCILATLSILARNAENKAHLSSSESIDLMIGVLLYQNRPGDCEDMPSNTDPLCECCMLLHTLSSKSSKNKAAIGEYMSAFVQVLRKNMEHAKVTEKVFSVLWNLVLNDDNKISLVDCDGVKLVVEAMRLHEYDASVQENGCAVLRYISAHSQLKRDVVAAGGAGVVASAFRNHSWDVSVIDQASAARRNMYST